MRKTAQKEIKDFINNHTWATLCTVSAEGNPYAIEFNYFLLDGYICGLIKPNGTTAKNIAVNQNICLKMCRTDESSREFTPLESGVKAPSFLTGFTAASVFGKGEFVHDEDGVIKGWDLLEDRLKLPKGTYEKFKEKFIKKKNKYPMFRMKPEKMTGITTTAVTSNK